MCSPELAASPPQLVVGGRQVADLLARCAIVAVWRVRAFGACGSDTSNRQLLLSAAMPIVPGVRPAIITVGGLPQLRGYV